MYTIFGYNRIEEFVQKLDVKFVQQFADPKKTPEIYNYVELYNKE